MGKPTQSINTVALLVRDCDGAIAFFTVAVFEDLYGKLWDLIQRRAASATA